MDPITLSQTGPIAEIVLNRPDKRNAFDAAMWQKLTALSQTLSDDRSVKIIVLRSATTQAFSAGADIAEFDTLRKDPELAAQNMATIEAAMASIEALQKPTIAAIDGICFGGGLALALCCDFRVAGPSARFAITPARLGLCYSLTNVNRLAAVTGLQMARRILMLAEVLKPDAALHCGLIDRLNAEEARAELPDITQQLLTLSQYSVRSIKQTIELSAQGHTGLHPEDDARMIGAFTGPDLAEGMGAFLEKRKPDFPFS